MASFFDALTPPIRVTCAAVLVFLVGLLVVAEHNHLPLVAFRPASQLTLPYAPVIDDTSYLAMAEGRTSEVASPFSKRVLYPWLCGMLSRHTRLSLPIACMTLNCAAWGLLAYCMAALLQDMIGLSWLSGVFLLTPVFLESLLLGYMPELFHTALLALFFLLILRKHQRWALAVLLLAFLTRESTLALCLVCAVISWFRGERRLAWGSIVVLVIGTAAGTWFARFGQPNVHHLPEFVYLPLKVAYNFLRSVLGIMFWSNSMIPARSTPTVIWTLPHSLQWGLVRQIGLSFEWQPPLDTLVSLLTVFGMAPLIFPHLWKKRNLFKELPLAATVAFWYGLILYCLAPSLGASVFRLVGEGWPLVWIAIPAIAKYLGLNLSSPRRIILAACYLLSAWLPFLTGFWSFHRNCAWLLTIPPFYIIAHRIIAQAQAAIPQSATPLPTQKRV